MIFFHIFFSLFVKQFTFKFQVMKNSTLILFFVFCVTKLVAQDTLIFKNNEIQVVKILEIRTEEVKYKKLDNLDGPDFIIKKSELNQIQYSNGKVESLLEAVDIPSVGASSFGPAEATFAKGQLDAMKYYRGYKPSGTGTIITTLLFTPAGLIPAIACGSTSPKDKNLGYPNSELFNNPDYRNGYREKAKRIKANKVWTNFGIGLGVNLVLGLILLSGGN